ncbi:MAG: hypothetical protein AABO41_23435 [Acidobacteriota bacterium]
MKAAPLFLRTTTLAIFALLLASQSIPAYGFFHPADGPDSISDDDRWDNSMRLADANAAPFTSVRSIAVMGKDVYVGGRLASAGGVPVSGIARWDGVTWSNVGGGIDFCRGIFCFPTAYALEVKGDELIVGGNFGSIGGVLANKVAKWDGSKWSTIGDGINICDGPDCVTVQSIALSGDNIYAIGNVLTDVKDIGGTVRVQGFVIWDGANWSPLGGGVIGDSVTASINAIAVSGTDVYVGGNFWSAGGIAAKNIVRWTGSAWAALGSGVEGCVSANPNFACSPYVATIAAKGKDVYAGGRFAAAGGTSANNIARWDGERWHALGSGANGLVMKLAVHGDWIYAGGTFTEIDGVKANGIARFDGSKWSPVGSGVDGFVDVIAFSDNHMYIAGGFSTAGGKPAFNIVRWALPQAETDPLALLPRIASISISHKKLTVVGERFDEGAVVLLNGFSQKTENVRKKPTTHLIARRSGRIAKTGDTLQVQNRDGKLSPEFLVAR